MRSPRRGRVITGGVRPAGAHAVRAVGERAVRVMAVDAAHAGPVVVRGRGVAGVLQALRHGVGDDGDVPERVRLQEDLPGCVRALAAVHAADGYPARWPADPAGWLSPPGLAAAWVDERAGAVAGHVGMVHGVDDPVLTALTGVPAQGLASLTRLFVAPPARGCGVGARLVERVQRSAVEQGLRLVLDVVDDGGPAVALYDRLGWRAVDHRLADWTTPEGHRPPVRVYVAPDQQFPVP